MTPERFLLLDSPKLKTIGFSRQKSSYVRELAENMVNGFVDLESFHGMDDSSVREHLIRIRGIGPWTADIYLLMALRRPDVWPENDLALAAAVQDAKKFQSRPSSSDLAVIAKKWIPWRAVAARIFWHFYLSTRSVGYNLHTGKHV